jgi:hypothetical protein
VKSTLYIGLALGLALATANVAAEDTIGLVKRSNGEVIVERGGVTIKAEKGTRLQHGDRLTTGKGAYAYVEMRGATPLAIGPETTVAVDRYVTDDKRVAHRSAPRLLQSLASYFTLNRQR